MTNKELLIKIFQAFPIKCDDIELDEISHIIIFFKSALPFIENKNTAEVFKEDGYILYEDDRLKRSYCMEDGQYISYEEFKILGQMINEQCSLEYIIMQLNELNERK